MIDDAANTISQNVWGALLILSWVIFGFVYRELKRELRDERNNHQSTRDKMLTNLESQNHMAAGLLSIQDGMKNLSDSQSKHTSLLIDALSQTPRRAG